MSELTDKRGEVYGPPEQNHSRTAMLWWAYLLNKGQGASLSITADDVCFMNILQKIARAQHGAEHMDNVDDIIGYAENLRELWTDDEDEST